jgi:hypothetical protein
MAVVDTKDAGKLGGDERARVLTHSQRSEIAKQGGEARWANARAKARADLARAKRLKARKAGRIASASRKANRGA